MKKSIALALLVSAIFTGIEAFAAQEQAVGAELPDFFMGSSVMIDAPPALIEHFETVTPNPEMTAILVFQSETNPQSAPIAIATVQHGLNIVLSEQEEGSRSLTEAEIVLNYSKSDSAHEPDEQRNVRAGGPLQVDIFG